MIKQSVKFKFFNNKNGKSKGIYSSLNCGLKSKDNKNNVKKIIVNAMIMEIVWKFSFRISFPPINMPTNNIKNIGKNL